MHGAGFVCVSVSWVHTLPSLRVSARRRQGSPIVLSANIRAFVSANIYAFVSAVIRAIVSVSDSVSVFISVFVFVFVSIAVSVSVSVSYSVSVSDSVSDSVSVSSNVRVCTYVCVSVAPLWADATKGQSLLGMGLLAIGRQRSPCASAFSGFLWISPLPKYGGTRPLHEPWRVQNAGLRLAFSGLGLTTWRLAGYLWFCEGCTYSVQVHCPAAKL
jgi:hypothetical protein